VEAGGWSGGRKGGRGPARAVPVIEDENGGRQKSA